MNDKEPINVPYFPSINEVINRHMKIIDVDGPPSGPSINDELEILINLMGMSRLIEHNMRVSYEKLNAKGSLGLPEPYNFDELIKNLEPYIVEKNKIELLHSARRISNGLVHANFAKVYLNTKTAYDITGLDLRQDSFNPPIVMFQTTITNTGLNVQVKGDEAEATDGRGNPIPLKVLVPDGTNDIDIDFKYYYLSGAFGFTWDVLLLAYGDSVAFMRDMKNS